MANGANFDGDKITFQQPGIAHTETALPVTDQVVSNNAFRLVLNIESLERKQTGPARIFTISENTSYRNLTVGQERTDLVLRLRTETTNLNGIPEFTIPDVFKSGNPVQVEVLLDQRQLLLRIDGQIVLERFLPAGPLAGWNPSFRAALGNELTGTRPWLGVINEAKLSSGDTVVDLLNRETIMMPPIFLTNLNSRFVLPVFSEWELHTVLDACLNFVCFIPLGFFLSGALSRRHSILLPIAACSLLSCAVEVAQLGFLEDHWPTLSDWVLNSLGATVGAVVWQQMRLRR